jgi:hypothetical protein
MGKSRVDSFIEQESVEVASPPDIPTPRRPAAQTARRRNPQRERIEQMTLKLDYRTRDWIYGEVHRRKMAKLPNRTCAEVVTEAIALLREKSS